MLKGAYGFSVAMLIKRWKAGEQQNVAARGFHIYFPRILFVVVGENKRINRPPPSPSPGLWSWEIKQRTTCCFKFGKGKIKLYIKYARVWARWPSPSARKEKGTILNIVFCRVSFPPLPPHLAKKRERGAWERGGETIWQTGTACAQFICSVSLTVHFLIPWKQKQALGAWRLFPTYLFLLSKTEQILNANRLCS